VVSPREDFPDGFVVFGLLEPGSDFDIHKAFDRVCDAFKNLPDGSYSEDEGPLSTGGNDISIDPENLGLFVILHEDSSDVPVAADSQQLATELGDAPEAAAVARCTRRIEFGFQYEDRDGSIFAEFLRLLAVLRTFRGVIFLDPRNPVATLGGKFTPPPKKRRRKK
jgi:hypothetical protein